MTIKNSFQSRRLGNLIVEAANGFASGEREQDGTIQVRMNNVDLNGKLDLSDCTRVPATKSQIAQFQLTVGDVLFNNTNSRELVGKTALFRGYSEPVLFSNHFTRLRVDGRALDPGYLSRWLTNQQQKGVFQGLCNRWVNQSSVRKEALLDLTIPLPATLEEQQRIAAILDKAEAIRRKRSEASESLEELPHALFLDMFGHPVTNPKGWTRRQFDEVCDSRLGKMLDSKKQTGESPRPYLRNLNVQWDRLEMSSVFEMDFTEDERREFRLAYGDVMICEGGAGVGQTAIWRCELEECYFQKSLHRVRPYPEVATSEYVAHLIWMLMKFDAILGSISSATIPHLTGVKLKSLIIPVPPLELQKRFTRQIESLQTAKHANENALQESSLLFDSLVSRAFRGEL